MRRGSGKRIDDTLDLVNIYFGCANIKIVPSHGNDLVAVDGSILYVQGVDDRSGCGLIVDDCAEDNLIESVNEHCVGSEIGDVGHS